MRDFRCASRFVHPGDSAPSTTAPLDPLTVRQVRVEPARYLYRPPTDPPGAPHDLPAQPTLAATLNASPRPAFSSAAAASLLPGAAELAEARVAVVADFVVAGGVETAPPVAVRRE